MTARLALRLAARFLAATTMLALALFAPPTTAAPGVAMGPARRVSPDDGRYHADPAVALAPDGSALVVWQGESAAGPGSEIFARRMSRGGAPLGPAFQVNADSSGEQRRPVVAALPGGGFVVAWDTNASRVWVRLLAADGTPQGPDRPVSTSTSHNHHAAAVATDGAGFAVAWRSSSSATGADAVLVRLFDLAGKPLRDEAAPFDTTTDSAYQLSVAIAALPGGGYVLVWEELTLGVVPGEPDRAALRLQRYDGAGVPSGTARELASSTSLELRTPSIAADAAGRLVVAWATYTPTGTGDVQALRMDGADLEPQEPITLSGAEPLARSGPAVAVGPDGSGMVVWAAGPATAGQLAELVARPLDGAGVPDGAELAPRAPDAAPAGALRAAASSSPAGGPLWVAWGESPPATEGSEAHGAIYVRRFVDQLFHVALPVVRSTNEAPSD